MAEGHNCFSAHTALQPAEVSTPYQPAWFERLVPPHLISSRCSEPSGEAGNTGRAASRDYPLPLPVSRALRYSETTSSVSSSTEVSATGLSYSIRPFLSRFTLSQTSKTWA